MRLNLKISTLVFLTCFLFQNSYSQQNTNGWYWINGQPQSNSLNWVKIIDATHYYAVGESGTFMKSSDGGDSWLINTEAGVPDPSFNSGATLRIYSAWFFNANTGILTGQSVANDGGKIRRTTDGGQTFTTIGLGIPSSTTFLPPRVTGIYFINSTTGFICGDTVVKSFKTTDAGLSWTLLPNLPSGGINYSCVYAKDENNIFLGCETNGYPGERRIVRTTNAGSTWRIDTIPGASIYTINDIEFLNVNTGFIAATGTGNYFGFTTNGGANWTQAIFPNTQMSLNDLKIIGSTVYALGSYNSYFYTSNLGATWDSVVFNDPTNVNQPYPSAVSSFDISGNDAIVVGGNGKINVSNDGGSSWRNKNYSVGNSEYCFSSIFGLPGTGKVWAGSNGGGRILYSSNNGDNWTLQQTSAANAFYDIKMLNSSTGYAAGGSFFAGTGYCFKTTTSGAVWTSLPITNPGAQVNAIDFVNVNTGWLVGIGGVLSKTTNGGSTWTAQATTPVYTLNFSHIDMFDANNGYLVSGANVWKTTNGGSNWDRLTTLPPALSWRKVQAFTSTTLYLGGVDLIYKSFDGGANWESALIPQANLFDMDWVDLNNGTVVGTAGYTAKTSNGGVTWTERNPGSSTLTGVSMTSKDTVFAVCDRNVWGAIFRLYDANISVTFNLKIGIEGLWNGSLQVGDTVKCHLRNSVSPYNEVEVATAVINNSGNGTFNFSSAPSGSYYLEITQRNSIETWSALPQAVVQGGSYSYDFTTSASQAFGNNMILKSGRYCNYSGDLNQDGSATLADLLDTYNPSSNFVTGYVVSDVNGDNTVDLSDITIVYNNSGNFVAKVTP